MRILIICTGNSCRSQMAHGFLQHDHPDWQVFSAGTHPANRVNPYAVRVMREMGIDISKHQPQQVDTYVDMEWDYVITVCDGAKEVCPVFSGKVQHRKHIGFEDPADASGTEEEILPVYRRIRDEIKQDFSDFFITLTP